MKKAACNKKGKPNMVIDFRYFLRYFQYLKWALKKKKKRWNEFLQEQIVIEQGRMV